ncbi:hypothetical protein FE784_20065 [Paenibacillus hemerocallicola]|uniref:Fibronectin type-III domain-containing protein n=1 Tax=Paenibacillus hemerocallicola TaxID=1172614 RepID=A0A5C4T5S2_9BACL|nr:fibronectin type III domain-containing protein [Paenibacillus hemerocallicola]TNJ64421.1 hypothetical protein FE784_20065 [Paenibacillus hemerocallicola]
MNGLRKRLVSALLAISMLGQAYAAYASGEMGAQEVKALSSVGDTVYSHNQFNDVSRQVYQTAGEKERKLLEEDPEIIGEAMDRRTPNSKHYLRKDGSYRAVITMQDQHYEAEDDKLYDIDTTLYKDSVLDMVYLPLSKAGAKAIKELSALNKSSRLAGKALQEESFKAPQVPFDATLPVRFGKGYSINKNNDSLTFVPVGGSNVAGVVYGKSGLLYPNAWNQTDVTLQVLESGIKETILLKDASAPHRFSFQVTGPLSESLRSNEFTLQPAWLVDADGTYRDVAQTLRVEKNKTYLDLTADVQGLIFPIVIDPTVILTSAIKAGCTDGYNNRFVNSTYFSYYNINGCNLDYGATAIYKYDLSSISTNYTTFQAALKTKLFLPEDYDDEGVYHDYSIDITSARVTADWNPQNGALAPSYSVYPTNEVPPIRQNYVYGKGFYSFDLDVSRAVQDSVTSGVNHGFIVRGQLVYGKYGGDGSYIAIGPHASLEVVYKSPPSTPVIVSPIAAEVVNTLYNIVWQPAYDLDTPQWNLRYQVQMSVNGGAWFDLVALTNPGATSYAYNFSGASSTTSNKVRIRTYNGSLYGNWAESGTFTVLGNRPPNAPANPVPGNPASASPVLIAGTTPTVQWTFSDPDPGNVQSAYQIVVYNSSGNPIHDTGWVGSGGSSYTVPAGVLSRGNFYFWRVKTWDNYGLESPLSESRYMLPNSLPSLSITSYNDNQTLYTNVLNFTWNYNDPNGQAQSAYQVVGTRDNWASWAYNSGEINGPASNHVTAPLALGTWSFAIRLKDDMEWGDWAYRSNISIPNLDAGPPTIPEHFRVIGKTSSSFTLAWTASTDDIGVSEYLIYNGATLIGTSPSTTFTASGLSQGLHAFTVKAKDVVGNESSPSRTVKAAIGAQGYYYDASGKLDYIILPNGQTLDYHYDANGNQTGVALN